MLDFVPLREKNNLSPIAVTTIFLLHDIAKQHRILS